MKDREDISDVVSQIISQGLTAFELGADDEKVEILSITCVTIVPYATVALTIASVFNISIIVFATFSTSS